jgi:hypothetical protein
MQEYGAVERRTAAGGWKEEVNEAKAAGPRGARGEAVHASLKDRKAVRADCRAPLPW